MIEGEDFDKSVRSEGARNLTEEICVTYAPTAPCLWSEARVERASDVARRGCVYFWVVGWSFLGPICSYGNFLSFNNFLTIYFQSIDQSSLQVVGNLKVSFWYAYKTYLICEQPFGALFGKCVYRSQEEEGVGVVTAWQAGAAGGTSAGDKIEENGNPPARSSPCSLRNLPTRFSERIIRVWSALRASHK